MLKDMNSSAIVAVSDLDRARRFYGETLGLEAGPAPMDEDCIASYRTGDTFLTVYQSDYAGSNQANAVTWDVGGELDAIVADLKGKGVAFEHYDMPGLMLKGDVHRAGEMGLVWLKDPDGNILHLMGR